MAELKMTFSLRPVTAIVFAAAFLGLLFAYYHLIEVSVRAAGGEFRDALVNDCSSRAFIRLGVTRGDLSRANEIADAVAVCKTIHVSGISANGGLVLPVMVRIELSADGHIPSGERVWYVSTSRSQVFPFVIYNIMTDSWPVGPVPVGGQMRYFYYLRV